MIKYTIRRLIQAIPTLFGISILSFGIMVAAPGDPTATLTFNPGLSPRQREIIRERFGVGAPVYEQYFRWLIGDDGWALINNNLLFWEEDIETFSDSRKGILRGDFGNSLASRRPVIDQITERIPATLELGVASLILAIAVGVPVGILAAVRRGGVFDNMSRIFAVLFNAIPNFWLGLILILLFGSWLRLLPMGSRCPTTLLGGCPPVYQRLQHLILPTFALSTAIMAGYSRYMRASMLDVMGEDYMRTALAKGLPSRLVWFRHGARNALIPLATFLGPALTGVLGGAVVTETIFSWPGLGRLAVNAVIAQDFPVVMATVIIGAVGTIIGYVLSDIFYAVIDPRIRLQ